MSRAIKTGEVEKDTSLKQSTLRENNELNLIRYAKPGRFANGN